MLAIYPGGRYELEQRYTQFVAVWSRPVHARLELGPLADALNEVDGGRAAGVAWGAPRATDTGPLLRLNAAGVRLSKQARYGHPAEREILRSGLSAGEISAAALSYFRHGLAGAAPRAGGFSWDETHKLNAAVDWAPWRAALPATLEAARAAAI